MFLLFCEQTFCIFNNFQNDLHSKNLLKSPIRLLAHWHEDWRSRFFCEVTRLILTSHYETIPFYF